MGMYTLVTEATSSVIAGAVGGEAGASVGIAGGATLGASSALSVVLASWVMLFSTGASTSGAFCKIQVSSLCDRHVFVHSSFLFFFKSKSQHAVTRTKEDVIPILPNTFRL